MDVFNLSDRDGCLIQTRDENLYFFEFKTLLHDSKFAWTPVFLGESDGFLFGWVNYVTHNLSKYSGSLALKR